MATTVDVLAEIRAAFPATPYPGDATLSDCWCDECERSVRNLRGKSWKQLRREDLGEDGGSMRPQAFRYYLPGLLCLAVQHPKDTSLASGILSRLVVSNRATPKQAQEVQQTVQRLSPRQRGALIRFLLWVGEQGWQAPLVTRAAVSTVKDARVTPYDSEEVARWYQSRIAANGS